MSSPMLQVGRAALLLLPSAGRSGAAAATARRLTIGQSRRSAASQIPVGNSVELGFYYRHPGKQSLGDRLIMEGFGAFAWFYVLYLSYNYPEMVIGHKSYPNPRKWTDAELGLPPLD